jgi:hypothetical protein
MIESNYNKQDFRDWYVQYAESYQNRFKRCEAAYIAGHAAAESDAADALADQCPQPGNELIWEESPCDGGSAAVANFLNAAEDLARETDCDLDVQIAYSGGEVSGIAVEAYL